MSQLSAFLRVIRQGESSQTDDAYYMINGGGRLPDLSRHPWINIPTTEGAKACGAYQFLGTTWGGLARKYGYTGFSEAEQDDGAAKLIDEKAGATDAIQAGDLAKACSLLHNTWTSLPGGSEQNQQLASAEAVFTRYGGSLAGSVSVPQPSAPTAPVGATTMPILALLPLIAQFIPQIMTLIKPTSQTTAKDAAIAQTVLNTVVTAAGIVTDGTPATAATVGAAVDKMTADPALAKSVQEAVVTDPAIMTILEIGSGGIAAARAAVAPVPGAPVHWWDILTNPVIYMSIGLFGLVYIIILNVVGNFGQYQGWDANTRSNVVFLVVGAAMGAITGFWFGTTQQSGKKDAVIAGQSSNTTT